MFLILVTFRLPPSPLPGYQQYSCHKLVIPFLKLFVTTNQRENYSYIVKIFILSCMIDAALLDLFLSICKTVTFFPLSADLTISSKSESCNWTRSSLFVISFVLILLIDFNDSIITILLEISNLKLVDKITDACIAQLFVLKILQWGLFISNTSYPFYIAYRIQNYHSQYFSVTELNFNTSNFTTTPWVTHLLLLYG